MTVLDAKRRKSFWGLVNCGMVYNVFASEENPIAAISICLNRLCGGGESDRGNLSVG